MIGRLAPQMRTIALTAAASALAVGAPVLAIAFAVPGIGLWLWLSAWRPRRDKPSEQPWEAPTSADPMVVDRTDRPSPGRVIRALGRVEAREVALSPWFAIGVGFCALMVVALPINYESFETWGNVVQDLPFLAHPLTGMMVLVGHRAGTRAERDGASELFTSCPTTARTRTLGVLASGWVPLPVLAVFFGTFLAVVGATTPDVGGTLGVALATTLLAGMLLGVGGFVLGVALARWAPNPVAPVIAVVAIGFASTRLNSGAPGEMSTLALLSTMPGFSDGAPLLTPGQAAFHLLWLVAITIATGAVAVVGRR